MCGSMTMLQEESKAEEPKQEEKKKKNDKPKDKNKPTKTTKKPETPQEPTPAPAVEPTPTDNQSTKITDDAIEAKKQAIKDAKPVEITNTQAPENNDVMLEKTVLMPRILLEEEKKEETPVAVPAEVAVPTPTMEPLPAQAPTPIDPNKPQKVTEEEFLLDSTEVQTNPFEIKEDGVK